MTIIVTNNSSTALSDRFNGVDITFPPGKRVLIDEDAAKHIFGFGVEDKTMHFARLGWLRSAGEMQAAMDRLAEFSFASFDPYAAFREEDDEGEPSQHLSPVAPDGAPISTDSDAPSPIPAKTSGSIMSRLLGASN